MFTWLLNLRTRRIYLDHAAKTPVRPHIARMLRKRSGIDFGNPSAIHEEGRRSRAMVDDARATFAQLLKVRDEEIVFTSGGTESNNLALTGVIESLMQSGRDIKDMRVVTTTIEHPSILRPLEAFEKKGGTVIRVPVDVDGCVDETAFEAALTPDVVLVTFAYANSEIGVVQDVKRLSRIVRRVRTDRKAALPYIHLDASQAPLYLPCAVDSLGVDLMTLDAQKFCGPQSVGVLMKRHHVSVAPLFFGGSQEEGLRPGTEHAPALWGAALAYKEAQDGCRERALRITKLRDYCIALLEQIPGVILNGSRMMRIANNVNVSIPGIDGEYAAVVLDHQGIAVSTKSACSGRTGSGSSVVYALGGDDARALSTLRITLGEATSKRNIHRLYRVLERHVVTTRGHLDLMSKK